jgi:hypothetical protein
MPKTSEMMNSKFLKKEDVGRGVLATVTGCTKQNVALPNQPAKMRWCLAFAELDKPLVLNATNIALAEQATGSDDTDRWIGQKIVLYNDASIMFGTERVGGIRIRAPKPQTASAPPPLPPMTAPSPAAPRAGESFEDDQIPF